MSNSVEYRARRRRSVSATDAAKTFGSLVDRVRETGVTYVVERSGRPVARICPVEGATFTMADFRRLVATLPRGEREHAAAVERVSARHNRPRVRRNPWAR